MGVLRIRNPPSGVLDSYFLEYKNSMYVWQRGRANLRRVVSSNAFLECDDGVQISQSSQNSKPWRGFGLLDSLLYQGASRIQIAVFEIASCRFEVDPSAGDGELFGVANHVCILVRLLRVKVQNNASWGFSITGKTGIAFASVTIWTSERPWRIVNPIRCSSELTSSNASGSLCSIATKSAVVAKMQSRQENRLR
jgi:hypothetical protein